MNYRIFGLALIFFIAACSPISKEAEQSIDKPVSCNTATTDMNVLEGERASVAKQIGVGVSNVLPVGAVIRILKREWIDGAKVATGKYNRDIKAKMVEISEECNVPLPESVASELG